MKSRLTTIYQNTEPSKNYKKEEILKINNPMTTRNKILNKITSVNNTFLNESQDNMKKLMKNKFNIENVKKNITKRNLSVRIYFFIFLGEYKSIT